MADVDGESDELGTSTCFTRGRPALSSTSDVQQIDRRGSAPTIGRLVAGLSQALGHQAPGPTASMRTEENLRVVERTRWQESADARG